MKQNEIIQELIEEDKEPSEKPPKQILNDNETLLLELFQLQDISQLINSNYRYQIEQKYFSYPEAQTPEESKKYIALYRIWLLLRIEDLKRDIKKTRTQNHNPFQMIYSLATYRRELRRVEWDLENFDKLTDWRHQIKCAIVRNKGHEPRKKQYKEALKVAREMWSKGDDCLRHEMAKYLKGKFPDLSYRKLQIELTPIADEYGRNYDPSKPRKIE